MSGGQFKFDFLPSTNKGDNDAKDYSSNVLQEEKLSPTPCNITETANKLIRDRLDRSEKYGRLCTLLTSEHCLDNQSPSTSLVNEDERKKNASKSRSGEIRIVDESSVANTDRETGLTGHGSEPQHSVDLHSTKVEPIVYVVPKHAMSNNATDLIPGVYEGGLKVWECSVDLCRFLARIIAELSVADSAAQVHPTTNEQNFDRVREAIRRSLGPNGLTMELGCGHGLPGCLILRENIKLAFAGNELEDPTVHHRKKECRGSAVVFADFNDFVLRHATFPNAQVNIQTLTSDKGPTMEDSLLRALMMRAIFSGGDWMGLSHKIRSGNLLFPQLSRHNSDNQALPDRFDLILASETTYTLESCRDTAFLLLSHLKIEIGVGLVATKRFYFGVGGGADLFAYAAKTVSMSNEEPFADLQLDVRIIASYDTGEANIRDILEVRCHRST